MSPTISHFIQGDRIHLQKHTLSNAQTMFEMIDLDRVALQEFLPWVQKTNSVQDSETFIKITQDCWSLNKAYEFGIYINDSNQYIGNIGAINLDLDQKVCEIGYWLNSKYSGNGYMIEAVKTLEKQLFNLGFFRIEIRCIPKNIKSQAVALNSGYVLDGVLRSNCILNNERRDSLVYSKLKSDL
ncbi:MAG: GNAT family N-acetyltransferase [Candidatus Cloacimonetes bacterium]|nr:GNAT family N-acetyltransferase [Candidatus Cloacimonadota bacterium]